MWKFVCADVQQVVECIITSLLYSSHCICTVKYCLYIIENLRYLFCDFLCHTLYVCMCVCQESGLYAYKIFGTMDVPADTCAKVYVDTEYRKVWDAYVRGKVNSEIVKAY